MLLAVNERLKWIIKSDFAFERQMAFRSSDTHLPACSPDSLAVLGPRCQRRFPLCCPQDLKTQKAPKPIRYRIKTSINILHKKKQCNVHSLLLLQLPRVPRTIIRMLSLMCCLLLVSFVGTAGFPAAGMGGLLSCGKLKNVGLGFNLKLSAQLWPRMKELTSRVCLKGWGLIDVFRRSRHSLFMSSSSLVGLSARIKTFISLIMQFG